MSYTGKTIDLSKYDKYGKQVELSKVEVQLGVTEDIQFQLKSINEFLNKANAADNKLQKAVSSVNELYAPYKLNLGYAKAKEKQMRQLEANFNKLAKELGVDVKSTEAFKLLNDAFSFLSQIDDTLTNMKDAIAQVK
jgi:septation ring formation regulator EzrA